MIRRLANALLPAAILGAYRRARLDRDMRRSTGRSTSDVFTRIYRENRWGGAPGEFCSGSGSDIAHAASYIVLVAGLIEAHAITSIVDLGCGDFRIGRAIMSPDLQYVGCDIVAPLIERNQRLFGTPEVRFECLDLATAPAFPPGDLCIVRQVFQHLGNAEIEHILRKLDQYRLVLISDEQVYGDDQPINADIDAFHGTRRLFRQGLRLERPPFNRRIEVLLEQPLDGERRAGGTYLRTVRLLNPAAAV